MASENSVVISGYLHKDPRMKSIPTSNGDLELCEGNLVYTMLRGDTEREMYIDVEGFKDIGYKLADFKAGAQVRVEGQLVRAAWKSKIDDSWQSKHVIRLKNIELSNVGTDPQVSTDMSSPTGAPVEEPSIPF